jgi:hypothetical protein
VKASKTAVEPLKLEPFAPGDERLMLPGDRAALEAFKPPKEAQYVLVSGLDGINLLRRDRASLLDPADVGREVLAGRNAQAGGTLSDLLSPGISDRGRLVGLWEYDTTTESIVWLAAIKKNKDLEAAVKRTEEFVRAQLGDSRLGALDSSKSRAPRIQALRDASGRQAAGG